MRVYPVTGCEAIMFGPSGSRYIRARGRLHRLPEEPGERQNAASPSASDARFADTYLIYTQDQDEGAEFIVGVCREFPVFVNGRTLLDYHLLCPRTFRPLKTFRDKAPVGHRQLLAFSPPTAPDPFVIPVGEMFPSPAPGDTRCYRFVFDEEWVQVCEYPRGLQGDSPHLVRFHRERPWPWHYVQTAVRSGYGASHYRRPKLCSSGMAFPISEKCYRIYPLRPGPEWELSIKCTSYLTDARGDLALIALGYGERGVLVQRRDGKSRHMNFGCKLPCGVIAPDGLTAYVWNAKRIVQFDIDV